ncbi:MAG: CoA synthetase [Betaproteobacteria bacterium]|nr:MAG: CoA synthetase [Betaproteobacteria bacterium]
MTNGLFVPVNELSELVYDGAKLAVPKDSCGVAMEATRELVRRGVRDLHLVCVPIGGIQADILIGSGAVRTLETSGVTLGEFGGAPRFADAIREGKLAMRDATCPAVHAALQAAQKGIPFIPLRGLIGSDLMKHRSDWKVIDNPFAENDPIAVLPAIRPDVSLFHAPLADRFGNVFVGRERELMTMAHASRDTLVTVEETTDENLLDDDARAGAVLPAIYVSKIAVVKQGAWPLALGDIYPDDETTLARYAMLARTADGFRQFVEEWLSRDLVEA